MTQPRTMRFVDRSGDGGPEVMRMAQGPVPTPHDGEALIRVMAAGINRPDLMQRKGLYPPPADASPVLGLEVAGEVVALGPHGTGFAVGDRVCALVNGGGYAEYCAAPLAQCLPWPAGFDAVHAASLPETYFTVWSNLFRIGRLSAGETVLVHGGTSGIGSTAIQLARGLGAIPYATAGTDAKCATCVSLGAEAAINYRREDFVSRIRTLTQGHGVNAILDLVGAAYFNRNLDSLAEDGRLLVVAVQGGEHVEGFSLSKVMRRRLTVTGSTMRPRSASYKSEIASALLSHVWPLLDSGACKPLIHAVFPFTQPVEAHDLMESGEHAGKIVLALR
jgi:NADPH2:quinone reductase